MNMNYRNTEITIKKYQSTKDIFTEIEITRKKYRNTEIAITGIQKYKLQKYKLQK